MSVFIVFLNCNLEVLISFINILFSRFKIIRLAIFLKKKDFFAIFLLVLLIFRRALILTKIIPYQEVEQLKWLACIVLTCIISLPFWYFEGATTFFNENSKIGDRPFWVGALFINIPMFFAVPTLSAFWLCPEAINYNLNSRNLQK